jgi:hypothetical protein
MWIILHHFSGIVDKRKEGAFAPSLSVASNYFLDPRNVAPVFGGPFVHSDFIASVVSLTVYIVVFHELPERPAILAAFLELRVLGPAFVDRVLHRKHSFLPLPRSFRIWRMLLCPAAMIRYSIVTRKSQVYFYNIFIYCDHFMFTSRFYRVLCYADHFILQTGAEKPQLRIRGGGMTKGVSAKHQREDRLRLRKKRLQDAPARAGAAKTPPKAIPTAQRRSRPSEGASA